VTAINVPNKEKEFVQDILVLESSKEKDEHRSPVLVKSTDKEMRT